MAHIKPNVNPKPYMLDPAHSYTYTIMARNLREFLVLMHAFVARAAMPSTCVPLKQALSPNNETTPNCMSVLDCNISFV